MAYIVIIFSEKWRWRWSKSGPVGKHHTNLQDGCPRCPGGFRTLMQNVLITPTAQAKRSFANNWDTKYRLQVAQQAWSLLTCSRDMGLWSTTIGLSHSITLISWRTLHKLGVIQNRFPCPQDTVKFIVSKETIVKGKGSCKRCTRCR